MSLTVAQALAEAVPRLQAAGVEGAALDARLLLAHVTGRSRLQLITHPDVPLLPEQWAQYDALVERRCRRTPLPYLIGSWEFLGLPFRVTPDVLIPRPETELLVESVAERLPERAAVLDVGAGSGCVAIGLARLRTDVRVTTLEPSPAAAAVAAFNAAALGVAERVRVVTGSFPENAASLGPVDAVVSNPPYIPSAVVDALEPEQRLHEPRLALDGGPDGLALLRALVSVTPALLCPGGLLAVEVMQDQATVVAALLRAHGAWLQPETLPDLAGIDRVVLAPRR